MEYLLKNGDSVYIRETEEKDAEVLLNILDKTSRETKFLSRNPGEIVISDCTIDIEKRMIDNIKSDNTHFWFAVEYNGEVVGQCSVRLMRNSQRYLHRAELGFMLLEKACNIGIGGKMMIHCLNKCREIGVLQAELLVVSNNERALNMYKSFGFEVVGTIPRALKYLDGTFATEYKMIKFLDKE